MGDTGYGKCEVCGKETQLEWKKTNDMEWIDVKDLLPEDSQEVIVMYELFGKIHYGSALFSVDELIKKGKFYCDRNEVLAWMPIPSFDEILEANKDVLERIKRRGDRS